MRDPIRGRVVSIGLLLRLTLPPTPKLTESLGGQLLEEDRVGRPVALEDLRLEERLVALLLSELLSDSLLILAERERFGLSKEVGEKDLVVEVVADGVLRLDGGEEVGGDELGALVNELG